MGARQQLAAWLEQELPDTIDVVADYRQVGRISAPVVQVLRTSVTKDAHAPQGMLLTEFDVLVAVPLQDATAATEDELDDTTDLVLEALEKAQWCAWGSALRAVLDNTYIAYRIAVTASTPVET